MSIKEKVCKGVSAKDQIVHRILALAHQSNTPTGAVPPCKQFFCSLRAQFLFFLKFCYKKEQIQTFLEINVLKYVFDFWADWKVVHLKVLFPSVCLFVTVSFQKSFEIETLPERHTKQ